MTPLGASSVIVGYVFSKAIEYFDLKNNRAVLASFFLNETLGHLGRLGCTLCIIGSVIIVLNAPPDKEIETVDEILHYAVQPGMLYIFIPRDNSLIAI